MEGRKNFVLPVTNFQHYQVQGEQPPVVRGLGVRGKRDMNIGHQKNPKIESTGVSGHPVSDECEFLRKHSLKLSFPLLS